MIKTAVLIDDDPDDLDLMKEAINEVDKSIVAISFQDPEEALTAMTNELIVLPNYIFIDINMPGIRGDKILRALRSIREFDSIPITVLSTSMSLTEAQGYKNDGANFTFQKPNVYSQYQNILKTIFALSR
jgi:CheY-like chemotaxis protein